MKPLYLNFDWQKQHHFQINENTEYPFGSDGSDVDHYTTIKIRLKEKIGRTFLTAINSQLSQDHEALGERMKVKY
jgi:hypothetical protein